MYKLLIADDEQIIREAVAELIDWKTLDIQLAAVCKNGMEALDAIMDTAPDIVMTDIKMPGIDGLELIEKIRVLDPHIQFIILTGYPEFEYARRALKYGVHEYLLKPISEESIIEAIENTKTALPVYSNSSITQFVTKLLDLHPTQNLDQSRELLNRYLSHYQGTEELRGLGLHLLIELHTRYDSLSSQGITHFTEKLIHEPDYKSLYDLITTQILELLFAPEHTKISLGDTIKSYVNHHLNDEHLSLKYIAENLLYINVNYLSRVFTKQTGENFSNYLNRTRIEKAKRLIIHPHNCNIHKVAEAVGFGGNPRYFSQVFKKYTGLTPTQFAEKEYNYSKIVDI